MPAKKDAKSIDANILLDYILQHFSRDQDKNNKVNKLFNPSNKGDGEIRIFVYTLGEVFKRVLEQRDGKSVDLGGSEIQRYLRNIQSLIEKGFITIVKMDSLGSDFQSHYDEIDVKDSIIQKGDKLALAAFCSDNASTSFYSFDRGINQSVWLQEYVSGLGKRIREL